MQGGTPMRYTPAQRIASRRIKRILQACGTGRATDVAVHYFNKIRLDALIARGHVVALAEGRASRRQSPTAAAFTAGTGLRVIDGGISGRRPRRPRRAVAEQTYEGGA